MKLISFRLLVAQRHIALLIWLLCCINGLAQDFSYEYLGQTLNYTIISKIEKTCQLKAGSKNTPGNDVTGSLVIPERVTYEGNEYNVATIGEYGFYGLTDLTSVTLPKSLTSIRSYAFYGCI